MAIDAYFKAAAAQLRRAAEELKKEASDARAEVTREETRIRETVTTLKKRESQKSAEANVADNLQDRMRHERDLAEIKAQITKAEQEFYARRDELVNQANGKEQRVQGLVQEAQQLESRSS